MNYEEASSSTCVLVRERDTRDNKQSRVLLRMNLDLFRLYTSTTKINYSCKLLLLQRATHCGRQKETTHWEWREGKRKFMVMRRRLVDELDITMKGCVMVVLVDCS